jgi:hypothetical protein
VNKSEFREKSFFDGAVFRWRSNAQVVPDDILIDVGVDPDLIKVCANVRDKEFRALLMEYRANYKGPTPEERAEARAAHGPGSILVNLLTGDTWRT